MTNESFSETGDAFKVLKKECYSDSNADIEIAACLPFAFFAF